MLLAFKLFITYDPHSSFTNSFKVLVTSLVLCSLMLYLQWITIYFLSAFTMFMYSQANRQNEFIDEHICLEFTYPTHHNNIRKKRSLTLSRLHFCCSHISLLTEPTISLHHPRMGVFPINNSPLLMKKLAMSENGPTPKRWQPRCVVSRHNGAKLSTFLFESPSH